MFLQTEGMFSEGEGLAVQDQIIVGVWGPLVACLVVRRVAVVRVRRRERRYKAMGGAV